ncbi:hypothetical protein LXL04_022903 [Taraxacum kok-saghyz]
MVKIKMAFTNLWQMYFLQNLEDPLEVLVISAQRKGKGMLFPKGGWESDESIKEAALRKSLEEAGVLGTVEFIEEEVKDKQGYLASFEDLYKEILQAMLKLDAKISEANEKFPNNLKISEWRPRFDGFFGISSSMDYFWDFLIITYVLITNDLNRYRIPS